MRNKYDGLLDMIYFLAIVYSAIIVTSGALILIIVVIHAIKS